MWVCLSLRGDRNSFILWLKSLLLVNIVWVVLYGPLYEVQEQISLPVSTKPNIFKAPSSLCRHLHHLVCVDSASHSSRSQGVGTLISSSFLFRSLCSCVLTGILCHICQHLWVWCCFAEGLMMRGRKKAAAPPALWDDCSPLFLSRLLCHCSFSFLTETLRPMWSNPTLQSCCNGRLAVRSCGEGTRREINRREEGRKDRRRRISAVRRAGGLQGGLQGLLLLSQSPGGGSSESGLLCLYRTLPDDAHVWNVAHVG